VLDGTKNLVVDLASIDLNAASVKFYCSKSNEKELFYVGTAPPAALPVTISNVEVSEEPLRTLGLYPPLAPTMMFNYRGYLLLCVDNTAYPSHGVNLHLYDIEKYMEGRPDTIVAGVGLDDGFWTVTPSGAFWTHCTTWSTGHPPEDWKTFQKDHYAYAAGSLLVMGNIFPKLQNNSKMALFVSERGLTAGLDDGSLMYLTPDQLQLDVAGKRASIVYRTLGDLRQILFTLE
jgi:hypothetical protein